MYWRTTDKKQQHMTSKILQIKTAMIGLGSVNQNLLNILADKRDRLRRDYNLEFVIVAVADSSGVAVKADGLDPLAVKAHKMAGKSVSSLEGYAPSASVLDILDVTDCDLLFEASPVDLKSGGVGLSICRKALLMGTSVVLANKAPIVLAFKELHQLADEGRASLKYSATVCGGLPVLNIGKRDLIAGDILKLQGVFNGTSNFILDSMADDHGFDAALREAQDIGAAEADPSLDIGGWDTANKLLIIANSIMGADITLEDITVEGIEGIDPDMLVQEKRRGNAVKLVASAEDGVFSVGPKVLPQSDFLSQCTGWEMAVEIHTDIYGIGYYKLWEREPIPTAGSMLRDALHIFLSDRTRS